MDNCLSEFVEQITTLEQVPPPANPHISSEVLFAALINDELKIHVGVEGLQQARQVLNHFNKGVQYCRENNLLDAYSYLQYCDKQLAELPPAAHDFVTLFRNAAWSNYYYKANQGKQAIELLREGFLLSAELERQGYPAFLYWRIGQLFNITTLLFKEKDYEAGHSLLKNALIFTYSGKVKDLLIDDWDGLAVSQVRTLQESSLNQLFVQVARQNTSLMHCKQYDNQYYYNFFFEQFLLEMEAETYNRMVIYNWMHAKASYIQLGLRDFLINTWDFLTDPNITGEYNIFKANLLAQVRYTILSQWPQDVVLVEKLERFSEANFMALPGNSTFSAQ